MAERESSKEVEQKVLVHLYNSVVVGSISSMALMPRVGNPAAMATTGNPRREDLKELYDLLGSENRDLFYRAAASIVEFAVYCVLDFLERYNRFDSQRNESNFPRLSLVYIDVADGKEDHLELSTFGSKKLGTAFKSIARNDETRRLIESAINQIVKNAPRGATGINLGSDTGPETV